MDIFEDARKEIKSYINEDKKIVVTIIRAIDYMNDIDVKFVGKAKCAPEDKFDVNIGKQISKQRAWIKYNKFATSALKKDITRRTRLLNKSKQMYEKYNKYEQQAKNKLKELTEEVN